MTAPWHPSATLETLRARAELLRTVRAFFDSRGVMEVDTPVVSRHGTVDRHIDSVEAPGAGWLHTSPEFAMKRLLAAGTGPIYQLCHVFRSEPPARLHNPEFLMLEWYRPGWPPDRLMDEVEALVKECGGPVAEFPRIGYREAFKSRAGLDPFGAELDELKGRLPSHGVSLPPAIPDDRQQDRDFWLDLWMGAVVGPGLGQGVPCFVHGFPATQCALARVRPGDPPLAERFELFWNGVELANGFHELTDAAEQRKRFEADERWRRQRGLATPPPDRHLLDALAAGMPEGSGVALGVDRLLMHLLQLDNIEQAMPFGADRA